ncbi:MAG: M1 family metallopeptidase [Flavobacteriales bacterium]|nr:M1 family metallopeptidase [Flavobacteriales bacterium]MBL0034719.1 M1 family metallopeptidase [Flavobacteriales bacterium]
MQRPLFLFTGACGLWLLVSCGSPKVSEHADHSPTPVKETLIMDQHSHARPLEAVITHLDLDLKVDMANRRIEGVAGYTVHAPEADSIVFDTDGLDIQAVNLADGTNAPFTQGEIGLLGRALTVRIPKGTEKVTIRYATGASARALQWLTPQQTADKKHPFLFTQGQAILTRTWIPIQDSPGIRITYSAKVRVPKELMAVMSATNPQQRSLDGTYSFEMKQAIPPYLIALAVGDLAFKPLGARTGVYAEPGMVDKAAWEFADMESMVSAAEELYGPYRWGRYDVIVLPPSFPFGGMENPMLTFATPTIIAGDRSLTALIAHELAHSWSGNLVTNATWDDFWLNEGFTVYFEKRICEKIYGKDYAEMLALLGRQDLDRTMADISQSAHPEDTRLKLHLAGRDPDDGMTDVAYEKGYSFLRLIESKVGREKFDTFLRNYFDAHAFQSMTTERFLVLLDEQLLMPNKVEMNTAAWVNGDGLPAEAIMPVSDRFAKVEAEIVRWKKGASADELSTKGWSTFEWLHFLRHLPSGLDLGKMSDLDDAFHFTATGNAEIAAAWFEVCINNDFRKPYASMDQFLTQVGRRKFLIPLYTALARTESGRQEALTIYKQARPNYHSVSVRTIDDLLGWEKVSSVSM